MISGDVRLAAAVIGCGTISHQHLPYLSTSPRAHLVGVCDQSPVSAEFARDRFGAVAAFTDVDDLFAVARPHVVHVLTPPHTHVELIHRCLDAGAHVICEKPLAPTAADTEAVLDHAATVDRVVIESRNLLFNDSVLAIDRLISGGKLGEIREVDIELALDLAGGPFGDQNLDGPSVQLPGGAVHDFLPHFAYLFLHFFHHTGDVEHVVGTLSNTSGNPRVGFDHLDALVTVNRYGGPLRGHLRIVSDLEPSAFGLWVRGTGGRVATDLYQPFLRFESARDTGKRAPVEQLVSGVRLAKAGLSNFRDKVFQHGTYHGLPRMLDAVYASLVEGRPTPITRAELVAAARLVDRLVDLSQPAETADQVNREFSSQEQP